MQPIKIIIEKHSDGYVAYPIGINPDLPKV
jgi:hypothetical protein